MHASDVQGQCYRHCFLESFDKPANLRRRGLDQVELASVSFLDLQIHWRSPMAHALNRFRLGVEAPMTARRNLAQGVVVCDESRGPNLSPPFEETSTVSRLAVLPFGTPRTVAAILGEHTLPLVFGISGRPRLLCAWADLAG